MALLLLLELWLWLWLQLRLLSHIITNFNSPLFVPHCSQVSIDGVQQFCRQDRHDVVVFDCLLSDLLWSRVMRYTNFVVMELDDSFFTVNGLIFLTL